MGALGLAIAGQSPDVIAHARKRYEFLAGRYLTADGLLSLPTAALLASGTC
jgi:hypothetical protein